MYLNESSMFSVVKKQFFYKFRCNTSSFFQLIAIQLLALFFSFTNISSWATGNNLLSVEAKVYSNAFIITLTILWALFTCISYGGRKFRNYDFTLVSNRLASYFSTLLFIFFQSIIASVSALCTGLLFHVLIFFTKNSDFLLWDNFYISFSELLLSMFILFLYVFLASSIGFFMGSLVQLSKAFVVILPALVIGLFILEGSNVNTASFVEYFIHEHSLIIFTVKTIAASGIIWCFVLLILSRLEVKN
ncbi:hypothetical protein [Niallia sp. 01092]|uniref:hypothetical protein n=1 Tax=unclassified Niallia TaxID=2837522 RepID=UPI003FD64339